MLPLTLFSVTIAATVLWKQRHHRPLVLAGVLAVCACVAAALGGVMLRAAGMPRQMTRLANQPAMGYQVLAATEDFAIIDAEDQVLRLSLPDGRITARYPIERDHIGSFRSAAIHGNAVLLGYHVRNAPHDGWALLDQHGWVHAPGTQRLGEDVRVSVSWSPDEQAFAIYGFERGQAEHRVDALLVDPQGHVRPGQGFSLPADQPYQVFCHVGERLLAHGGPYLPDNVDLPPCAVMTQQDGARTCVPLDPIPTTIVFCPEQQLSQPEHGEAHWLSPQGLRSFDAPANALRLRDGFPFASADGLVPVPTWFTSDLALVLRLGPTLLRVDSLGDAEASALGHMDSEMRLQLVERDGTARATSYVTRFFGASVFAFRSGGEIVVFDGQLTQRARFDADTLRRLDPPGAVTAVRERLALWGGHSSGFELALAASLLLSAAVWPLAGLAFALRRTAAGRVITAQRVLLVYLLLAAPTLVVSATRLWHL